MTTAEQPPLLADRESSQHAAPHDRAAAGGSRGVKPRLSLLAPLARERLLAARLKRFAEERWVPTEEERKAMDEGSLIVCELLGGPTILIDLRAADQGSPGPYPRGERA